MPAAALPISQLRPPVAACMAGTAAAALLFLMVNSGFTVLKETPLFWRDLGGYPTALRELVLIFYYPLLGMNLILCATLTALIAYDYHLRARPSWWAVALALMLWSILFLNAGLLVANNVENVLSGRDVHYPPPLPEP